MKSIRKLATKKYYVLQLQLQQDTSYPCNCMCFHVRRNLIRKERAWTSSSLLDALDSVPKNAGVLIQIFGYGVLTRFSEHPSENLFDELEQEDFYLDLQQASSGWTLQSTCRITSVDQVLDQTVNSERYILDLGIGLSAVPILEGILHTGAFSSQHFVFEFKDGAIAKIHESIPDINSDEDHNSLTIGDDVYSSTELPALAFLMKYLLEGPFQLPRSKEQHDQWRFFHMFRKTGVAALVILFLCLMVNFLSFSHGRDKLSQLKSSGSDQLSMVAEIKRLESQLQEYELLKVDGPARPDETFSFYLEEVASCRVQGLWFDNLCIYPVGKRMEKGKPVIPDENYMILAGETRGPGQLNRVIENIKKKEWVADVQLMHYEKPEEKIQAEFELSILKK